MQGITRERRGSTVLHWWMRRTSDNAHVSVRSEFQSASHYSPHASGARAVQSLWGCLYSPSVPFFLAMALLSVTHVCLRKLPSMTQCWAVTQAWWSIDTHSEMCVGSLPLTSQEQSHALAAWGDNAILVDTCGRRQAGWGGL